MEGVIPKIENLDNSSALSIISLAEKNTSVQIILICNYEKNQSDVIFKSPQTLLSISLLAKIVYFYHDY